jgi:tRNA threonylcarbamoyladenosine biosynthesis protein TsaB
MYLLAIDTATNSGGVALSRNAEVVGMAMLKTPLRYSDKLIYYIDFLLDQLEVGKDQIDSFVVANGPGSFTGLRIGIAMAKAMAQGLERPAIGITTLEALAFRFRAVATIVAPLIDARRQQVYGGCYQCDDTGVEVLQAPTVKPPAEWLRDCSEGDCLFVGDAAQMYAQTISSIRPEARVLRTDNCILTELCQLGYLRYLRGETGSAGQLEAIYIRPSDAELSK